MNNRSKTVIAVILTLLMTFMEMTALPAALFCNIKIKDIAPIYITLMLNFLIAFAILAEKVKSSPAILYIAP